MSAWLIVASWWFQEFLDKPRRRHLTTDPACVHHKAPYPGSWLDRASRGLECEPCMIRGAFDGSGCLRGGVTLDEAPDG